MSRRRKQNVIDDLTELQVKLGRGMQLLHDKPLGKWMLHENGISACDGRIWEVDEALINQMKGSGELVERRKRMGGVEWWLCEAMRTA